ncbi:MAG TPA: DUF2511 domain-containing protein [Gaiellaceae bacterium]|nr:DUF2511 domain-containing protein [Gaiellaceae bacterium]
MRYGEPKSRSRSCSASATAFAAEAAFAVLFVAGLTGCASSDPRSSTTDSRRHSQLIRQADYGETWPFGPNEGLLHCRRAEGKRIVTLEVDGVNYAVNEAARRQGAAGIRVILATDHSGIPFDYSPVLADGLELC